MKFGQKLGMQRAIMTLHWHVGFSVFGERWYSMNLDGSNLAEPSCTVLWAAKTNLYIALQAPTMRRPAAFSIAIINDTHRNVRFLRRSCVVISSTHA